MTAPEARETLAGTSILVVDDDADALDLLDLFLKHHGAFVTTARTATEAVESFKACPPAIVVTDVAMPVRDGVWLVTELRAMTPHVPVVAFTALARRQDRDEFLAAGVDAYIAKPSELNDLLRVVLGLLART